MRITKKDLALELSCIRNRIIWVMDQNDAQVEKTYDEEFPFHPEENDRTQSEMRKSLILRSIYRLGAIYDLPNF